MNKQSYHGQQTTAWSAWVWSPEHQKYYCGRLLSNGAFEYKFHDIAVAADSSNRQALSSAAKSRGSAASVASDNWSTAATDGGSQVAVDDDNWSIAATKADSIVDFKEHTKVRHTKNRHVKGGSSRAQGKRVHW
ncbi:hypothetical protein EsH8_VII_000088 [Colletotrichum jinshuiense]